MEKFSQRVLNLQESKTLATAAVARALKNEGKDVISLTVGDTDFDTPNYILDAAKEAMYQGKGHHYAPVSGLPELKQAIIDFHLRQDGVSYQDNQIYVGAGAKIVLYYLCQVLLEAGDEVLIPSPYWVSYVEQVNITGAKSVIVETSEADGFLVTPELLDQYRTDKTKVLILNSPNNPSGITLNAEQLRAIGDYCVAHDIIIIADEMYNRLVYNGTPTLSMAAMSEEIKAQTLVVNGHSKVYSMTGWRLGYVMGDSTVIAMVSKLASQATGPAGGVNQYAGAAALNEDEKYGEAEKMRQIFEDRLNRAYDLFNSLPGFRMSVKPQGAFYLFPDVSEAAAMTGFESVNAFNEALLAEALVAGVPGDAFGMPDHIRYSYAISIDRIEEAVQRISAFIEKHRQ
ncbi:aspartate aminotransferase [Aerococcus urinaehominis]|uniref:Aspartate aminotransferase n=1 Tax=Aerococcus urinaehominis TaxID=128944 RepID=A0A0X8FLW4_9LACT|nr:pyridoxal phosphate-dependent aminotransferase [Aerococcus urinaehominis]AMB99721.1 aspartate aminotransferase [Aerococcus urinaehominis]SDL91891.1 Aspartate/methionine/tyrosine aminotransferase [Aerococcus urinaehominis]